MKQVIFSGDWSGTDRVNPTYNMVQGGGIQGAWSAEVATSQVMPSAGTFSKLYVKTNIAPGPGTSYTFTLRKNGAATTVTCTIADPATSASDLLHSVVVAAGDLVDIECAPSVGGPFSLECRWSLLFEGSVAKESIILGNSVNVCSAAGTRWCALGSGSDGWDTPEIGNRNVIPTAGKIKNLYVMLDASPGVNPDGYKFTLRLNGADTLLAVTITDPATTGNNVANEIAVVPDDIVSLQCEPLNGPANTPLSHWGVTFVPTIDGESVIMGSTWKDIDTAADAYHYICNDRDGNWGTPEAAYNQLGQTCTVKKLYIKLLQAPGVGASYTFTYRLNGAGTTLTCTVAGAVDTTAHDIVNSFVVAAGDDLTIEEHPAGGPLGQYSHWSAVGYLASGTAPQGSNIGKLVAAGVI